MSKELNCMNCCIGDFKESLCDCNNGMCKEYKKVGRAEDFEKEVLKRTMPKTGGWIPCSERLPKARESVILSTKEWTGEGCYWETTKNHVIWKGYRWNATYWDNEVIAWMPLPEPWKGSDDE